MIFKLREIREDNELTQRDVAKLLNVSKTTYNYYETMERIITVKHLNTFCNLFNVSMDYTLNLDNNNILPAKKYIINAKLIGQRIKIIRQHFNLKQQDLAQLFNTSQSTISAYENGRTIILTAFIYTLCKKLNISADYLTGRSNTMKTIMK